VTTPSLRRRIVLPLALAFGAVAVVMAMVAFRWMHREVVEERERAREVTTRFVENQLDLKTRFLLSVARDLVAHGPIQAALVAGDTDALLSRARPWLERQDPLHLAHLHFFTPEQEPLALLHGEGFEMDPGEGAAVAAAAPDAAVAGLGVGNAEGRLTVRVAAPIAAEGGLLGWVELAQDASDLSDVIREVLGVEVVVAVQKSLLEREAWSEAVAGRGYATEWERYPERVVVQSSISAFPGNVDAYLAGDLDPLGDGSRFFTAELEGTTYTAEGVPLMGADGEEIGELLLLGDYSRTTGDFADSIVFLLMAVLLSGAAASWFVYRSQLRHLVAPVEAAGEMALRATRGEPVEPVRAAGEEMETLTDALNRMVVELAQVQTAQTELLVERALDAVVGVDDEGRTVSWNLQAEAVFGWTREEILGRDPVERIVPADTRERVRRELARLTLGSGSDWADRRLEAELLTRTGERFPAEISVTPTRTSRGWVVSAFIRDITRRRAAEERIRTSEARYRRLVETANVVPWEGDSRTTRVTYVGPQAEALLGFPVEAWYEDGFWARHLHDADREFAFSALAEAVGGEGPDSFEYRMVDAEGETVWVRDVVTAEMGPEGPVVRGFRFDVTARRNLEDQLSRSLRLEAVGRLAGGVAHDFNNVVTSVLGYTDLLLDRLPDDAEGRAELQEIRRVTTGAGDLTTRLLAFARQKPLRPRKLELETRLLGMDRMIRRLIGEDVEVALDVEGDGALAELDPGQFEQVVVNLVLNARDAMPQGGSLVLETRTRALGSAEVEGHGVEAGTFVTLTVQDSGVGMDSDLLQRIFEPFFTTKAPGEGTGLGLSTVYGVARQAGGFVEVDSAPGRGTVVQVHLPRVEGAPDEVDRLPGTVALGGTEGILLAEDDPQIRETAREALTRRGYTVVTARNGQELLERAREEVGVIDLVVTDMIMPVMGGVEAVDRLLGEMPGLRVLFISGYPPDDLPSLAPARSGLDFLAKPFTPDDLLRRVRSILDGARETSPVAAETESGGDAS
jgi:PAS domain S-box-containing protein